MQVGDDAENQRISVPGAGATLRKGVTIMNIDQGEQPTTFADAGYGSILETTIENTRLVRVMKAHSPIDEGEKFVTLGPFHNDDNSLPSIHYPRELTASPVFDVTEHCQFIPSLSPVDLLAAPPGGRDNTGKVFVSPDHIVLGVFSHADNMVYYLNLRSGAISIDLVLDQFYTTSRWTIKSTVEKKNMDVLVNFPGDVG